MRPARKSVQEFDFSFKVLILGDIAVGKSKLTERFYHGTYTPSYQSTLGLDYVEKIVSVDGKCVRLQIWDTAGQERYRTLTSSYYRGSMGVLLLYDITVLSSFHNLQRWIENIQEFSFEDISIVMVGSKYDLDESRIVNEKSAEEFAREHDLSHYLVSSKSGQNVEEAFTKLCRLMVQAKRQRQKSVTAHSHDIDPAVLKEKNICPKSCHLI